MSDLTNKKTKVASTPQYTIDSITRYQKTTVKKIGIDFYYDTDASMLVMLDTLKNMSAYIKGLILSDININPEVDPSTFDKSRRYNKSECRRISFLANKTTEKSIIDRVLLYPNRSAYIRSLIKKDMNGVGGA